MLRRVLVTSLLVSLATVVAPSAVGAQPSATTQSDRGQRQTFEVASVRPSPTPAQLVQNAPRGPNGELMLTPAGIRTFPGGRFTANVVTLRRLIAWAYDVQDWQIEGSSKWMESEYFSIEARAQADATPAQFKEMVQSLLAERFRLEARRGSKSISRLHRSHRCAWPFRISWVSSSNRSRGRCRS